MLCLLGEAGPLLPHDLSEGLLILSNSPHLILLEAGVWCCSDGQRERRVLSGFTRALMRDTAPPPPS